MITIFVARDHMVTRKLAKWPFLYQRTNRSVQKDNASSTYLYQRRQFVWFRVLYTENVNLLLKFFILAGWFTLDSRFIYSHLIGLQTMELGWLLDSSVAHALNRPKDWQLREAICRFSHKSIITIAHGQNIIQSKTHLDQYLQHVVKLMTKCIE